MFFCTFLSWLILSPLPRSSVDSLLQAQSYSDVSLSAFLSCCQRPYKPLPCHDTVHFVCSFLKRTCLHSYKHLKKDTLPCFFLNSLNLAQFEAQGWCSEMFPPLNLIDPNKNPVKPITCLPSLGSSYLNCSLLVPFQPGWTFDHFWPTLMLLLMQVSLLSLLLLAKLGLEQPTLVPITITITHFSCQKQPWPRGKMSMATGKCSAFPGWWNILWSPSEAACNR